MGDDSTPENSQVRRVELRLVAYHDVRVIEGRAIQRAREERKLTQRQVADALGVSLRTVGNWESGATIPRNRRGALEKLLGIGNGNQRPVKEAAPTLPEATNLQLITEVLNRLEAAESRGRPHGVFDIEVDDPDQDTDPQIAQ